MYGYVARAQAERLAEVKRLTVQIAAAEAARTALIVAMRVPTMGRYPDYDAPSWAEVAEALGVSKQAAQRKYGPAAAAEGERRAAAKLAAAKGRS